MKKIMILKLSIFISFALLLNGCMTSEEYSVDQEEYLGNLNNRPDIYESSAKGFFYSPFNASIFTMDRLMLVSFKDDPEYREIELQIFDDDVTGKGALVIMYRNDTKVDIYYEPGLNIKDEMYQLGSKRSIFPDTEMQYRLNITAAGFDAFLKMKDKSGKQIEFFIKDEQQDNKPTAILAPIGISFEKPGFFPLFYLKEFDFVPLFGSEIYVRIDGIKRKIEKIPVPVNGSFVYLARYSATPIIGKWNKNYEGELEPLQPNQSNEFKVNDTIYSLIQNNGHYEISKIIGSDAEHEISFAFSPPVPDLICLKDGTEITGRFSAGADRTTGIIAGEYRINRNKNQINMTIHPIEGWQPMSGKLWVKTYYWSADIEISDNNEITMKSEWTRKE